MWGLIGGLAVIAIAAGLAVALSRLLIPTELEQAKERLVKMGVRFSEHRDGDETVLMVDRGYPYIHTAVTFNRDGRRASVETWE